MSWSCTAINLCPHFLLVDSFTDYSAMDCLIPSTFTTLLYLITYFNRFISLTCHVSRILMIQINQIEYDTVVDACLF